MIFSKKMAETILVHLTLERARTQKLSTTFTCVLKNLGRNLSNVVVFGRESFLTGVITTQKSQQTLKFWVRHQK